MKRFALPVVLLILLSGPGCSTPEAPDRLEETGLYEDFATQTLRSDLIEYQPRFVLWSDSAAKKRWAYIPAGKKINTSNPDHWIFPEGTKFWKEFWRDGKRIETRIQWKAGPDREDWVMMAYAWNEEQTEATKVPNGLVDGLGTPHNVPDTGECQFCHGNTPGIILSFSAVQLNHDLGGANLDELNRRDLLSHPIDTNFELPGNETEKAALGYFHVNCGMCHNPNGSTNELEMDLWLRLDRLGSVRETNSYQSTINVQGTTNGGTFGLRLIRPGRPEESGIMVRMGRRGINKGQMPPVGTEITDPEGIKLITDFISGL